MSIEVRNVTKRFDGFTRAHLHALRQMQPGRVHPALDLKEKAVLCGYRRNEQGDRERRCEKLTHGENLGGVKKSNVAPSLADVPGKHHKNDCLRELGVGDGIDQITH